MYFIQGENGGPIKIGVTDNIDKRLKQMQTGNPEKLILLHLTYGGRNLEEELHLKFSQYLYRGEWFNPAKEILEYIEELKIRDENEQRLLSIVELALAFGEILTANEKKLLQEIVNGAKLGEGYNWSKYLGIKEYYEEYLKNPRQFIKTYEKHLNL